MRAIAWSVLLVMALVGCTSDAHIRVQPGEQFSYISEKNEGVAFFSLSVSGSCVPKGTIFIAAQRVEAVPATRGLPLFVAANPFVKSDYADHYAVFHSRAFAQGDYNFIDLVMDAGPLGSSATLERFQIPFRVTANKAAYLGRINIGFYCGAPKERDGFRISIHDDSAYDIATFKRRSPRIADSVVVEIPAPRR